MLNAKFTGADTVILNIRSIETKVRKEVANTLNRSGIDIVTSAQRRAPVDEATLKNAIGRTTATPEDLQITISVNVFYAAYIEFGTRKYAQAYVSSLPAEWQKFAGQFKGSAGGSFEQLVKEITEWVYRKGIANRYSLKTKKRIAIKLGSNSSDENRLKQAAYAIALSILRNGIKPHPYFVPAVDEGRRKFIENLNRIKL